MGYEIVEFSMTAEEVYEIRKVFLGLILAYFMKPSLDELMNSQEEPLESYKFLYKFYNSGNYFRKYMQKGMSLRENKRMEALT